MNMQQPPTVAPKTASSPPSTKPPTQPSVVWSWIRAHPGIARMDKVIDAQSALEREMIEAHSALLMQLEVNDRRVSEQLNATRESSRQETDTLQDALRDIDTDINDLSACVADISDDVDNSTVCRRIGNRSRQ